MSEEISFDQVMRSILFQVRTWSRVADAGRKAGEPSNEFTITLDNGQRFQVSISERTERT